MQIRCLCNRSIMVNHLRAYSCKIYAKHHIKENYSSRYHEATNGLSKAFNKTLHIILEKMVDKNKKTWFDKLPQPLWAYKATLRTSTTATLYSLVFDGYRQWVSNAFENALGSDHLKKVIYLWQFEPLLPPVKRKESSSQRGSPLVIGNVHSTGISSRPQMMIPKE